MDKRLLRNGLTILSKQLDLPIVCIQVTVKTGSDHETLDNNGIAHFVEHMLFEGTEKRDGARAISNEIEAVGGVINAYTSNQRTCYYIKVPRAHFTLALDLLSDLVLNSVFPQKYLEKERKVILKEINLHRDEPRSHQWQIFQRALFGVHAAGRATSGTVKTVSEMSRNELVAFYEKHYAAESMIVSIVGGLPGDAIKRVEHAFSGCRENKEPSFPRSSFPAYTHLSEKRKMNNSYFVMGYRTVARTDHDSYVFDVIRSILGRGQSGAIFEEIRNKRGLAYEVGVYHDALRDYGYLAIYLNTHKNHFATCLSVIFAEFKKLESLPQTELDDAKGYLIGQYVLDQEDTQSIADGLGFWEMVKDVKLSEEYLTHVSNVTLKDIARVAKKYFTRDYAMATIEQKD
ncbi:MAG: pitrilysin family protein [Nanoarchaeota archaeon]|nr:pitrilysin family protein [Nanoarchaeota archaeon]